jgi:hypothetical protein
MNEGLQLLLIGLVDSDIFDDENNCDSEGNDRVLIIDVLFEKHNLNISINLYKKQNDKNY